MTTQTPWVERIFHFDFDATLFPVIFSRLEGTLFRLQKILQNADDERSSHHPYGWSVKQHVGHLFDLEELWWQRLNDYEQGKELLTPADITNPKTEAANHNENTLENLVNAFAQERQKMLETVYELEENELNRVALHQRLNQPFRLVDLLYFVAEHDDHHLAAISNLLRKPIG